MLTLGEGLHRVAKEQYPAAIERAHVLLNVSGPALGSLKDVWCAANAGSREGGDGGDKEAYDYGKTLRPAMCKRLSAFDFQLDKYRKAHHQYAVASLSRLASMLRHVQHEEPFDPKLTLFFSTLSSPPPFDPSSSPFSSSLLSNLHQPDDEDDDDHDYILKSHVFREETSKAVRAAQAWHTTRARNERLSHFFTDAICKSDRSFLALEAPGLLLLANEEARRLGALRTTLREGLVAEARAALRDERGRHAKGGKDQGHAWADDTVEEAPRGRGRAGEKLTAGGGSPLAADLTRLLDAAQMVHRDAGEAAWAIRAVMEGLQVLCNANADVRREAGDWTAPVMLDDNDDHDGAGGSGSRDPVNVLISWPATKELEEAIREAGRIVLEAFHPEER
ncbi:hypothetical protein GGR56DRAFT_661334 [Xylariaceae sp. FL0804]|nr:hypothetical protein GGR56DRAFT_661334 [Xylariaceae sp. FL0804]